MPTIAAWVCMAFIAAVGVVALASASRNWFSATSATGVKFRCGWQSFCTDGKCVKWTDSHLQNANDLRMAGQVCATSILKIARPSRRKLPARAVGRRVFCHGYRHGRRSRHAVVLQQEVGGCGVHGDNLVGHRSARAFAAGLSAWGTNRHSARAAAFSFCYPGCRCSPNSGGRSRHCMCPRTRLRWAPQRCWLCWAAPAPFWARCCSAGWAGTGAIRPSMPDGAEGPQRHQLLRSAFNAKTARTPDGSRGIWLVTPWPRAAMGIRDERHADTNRSTTSKRLL
jgi:hypothetical protein